MQNTYWFLLIQFILQSHLSTHGVRAGFLRWTNKIPPAATKWSELNEIDCTDFLKHINPSTKLTESQSDELVAFWKQGEHLKNLMEISTTNFPDLIQETNKILLSPKETWHSAIIKLFDQNYLSHPYQYYCKKSAFFEIMRQFLSLENIPLNFLQVTHIELLKLKDRLEEAFGLYNLNGLDFLNKLLDISKERYVTSINKLEDRDLNKFVASQMELGEHGRVLIGDWLSGDQKALLKFWMLRKMGLYSKSKKKSKPAYCFRNPICPNQSHWTV
ncbi:hypothetical protein DFH28DRAFT_505128 [Melampsora americana]|nr:hypothetical protein DFH28DRAFT_505128 [Melampsora americana]